MPIAQVNGVKLVFEDLGLKSGIPLVFVHGWTADMHRWDEQVKFFSPARRVIRLDLRGHGDSEKPVMKYSIKQFSEDINGLLNLLDIEKAIPVGHSMGGMAVQQFTLDYPEKVEKLILVNSIGKMKFSLGRRLMMSGSKSVPFKLFVQTNIQRAFKKGFPKDKLKEFVRLSQGTPRYVVMSCFDAMGEWDVLERLGSIKVKTLIIHGLYDIQLPASEALKLALHIPGSVLKIIDCGHESPIENPAALSSAIDNFI
ncbi:MAG: alpha/beta hydrolase [Firmicutes bacterium]|nr:alpha/beta hydrolase [Bacillota bacterium]